MLCLKEREPKVRKKEIKEFGKITEPRGVFFFTYFLMAYASSPGYIM